jgi:hypothetical protein
MVRPATPSGSADRVLDTRAPRKGEDYQCAIGDYFKTIDIYDSAGKWIGQRDESWCYGDTLPATKVPAGGSVDVGSGARPGEGILVNATAVEPVAPGYLNVRNPAAQWDANSSVNHGTGGAVANEVFVQPDAQGKFSVSTFSKTHIILDILGYTAPNMVRPATANGSADRVLDTRQSMRGPDYQCAAGERADYYKVISYPDGSQMTVGMCYGDTLPASKVPAGGSVCVDTDARPGEGILVNATAVEPVAPGYLNVRNPAAQWDANSSVNHGTGGAVANEVFVQPDAQGNFCVSTYSSSHVILDILGYTAPNMVRPATPSGSADRVLDTRQ